MYVKWTVDVEIRSFLRCLDARAVLKAVQIEEYVVLKRLAVLESESGSYCTFIHREFNTLSLPNRHMDSRQLTFSFILELYTCST